MKSGICFALWLDVLALSQKGKLAHLEEGALLPSLAENFEMSMFGS